MGDHRGMAIALTIAGSDPSGGAGIQADLKTFHEFKAYGEAVITLLTVQNTMGVPRVAIMAADLVREQIEAVLSDIPPLAIKTGALGDAAIIAEVAEALRLTEARLVVDPVMISKHGVPLMADEAKEALATLLLPRAFLVMPNLPEAEALTGLQVRTVAGMREAARRIREWGCANVLIKGGHLMDRSVGEAVDVLLIDGEFVEFSGERIETQHTHGTGCTYSAAITALLAHGWSLRAAVAEAKEFITEAIRENPGLGSGHGPVNHFVRGMKRGMSG